MPRQAAVRSLGLRLSHLRQPAADGVVTQLDEIHRMEDLLSGS